MFLHLDLFNFIRVVWLIIYKDFVVNVYYFKKKIKNLLKLNNPTSKWHDLGFKYVFIEGKIHCHDS